MKLKEVIEKDYGIVVNNREEYDRLAKILDENGLRWKDNQRYTEYSPSYSWSYEEGAPFIVSPSIGKWDNRINDYIAIPLSDLEEETELDRLRRENAELKAQLSQQQPKSVYPKVGYKYFYVINNGLASSSTWCDDDYDKARLSIGNVHRTKEDAEAWFERKQLEHKMNEGGKVQVYQRFEGVWCFIEADFPSHGSFSSMASAQFFLSDPKNIEMLNKHLR